MKLNELLKGTGLSIHSTENPEIKGISTNSRKIKKGFLFIALKGNKTDGHKYINEAIEKGAIAILSERKVKTNIINIQASDILNTISKISSNFYKNPSEKLIMLGITGTKGKTTVSYLIEQILKQLGEKPAVIGTINYRTYKKIIAQAQNTTPQAPELNHLLSLFIRQKVKYCLMEVSSHALELKRVEDIHFDHVIFTNFQSDHLDFHKNKKNYFKSKLHLFELLFKSKKKNKFAILNADDRKYEEIAKILKDKIPFKTFSIKNNSDFKAENIKIFPDCSHFQLKIDGKKYTIFSKLIGEYNIYNLLSAIAYLHTLSFPMPKIIKAISKISSAPGRLEKIKSSQKFAVYIDYAHTTDSLKNVLLTLKKLPHNKIITVFGCGGNRDKTKRGPMGKTACSLSDYVIITSDNPRQEKPTEIMKDIEKPLIGKYKNYEKIINRKKAIFKAIKIAKEKDIVLIAGKGHEKYQIIGNKKIKFDDKEIAIQALKTIEL